jgi:hypothetical protein
MTDDQPARDEYERQLRTTAVVGGVYGLAALIGLLWLLWHGAYLKAVGWTIITSFIWNVVLNPQLVDIPIGSGGRR